MSDDPIRLAKSTEESALRRALEAGKSDLPTDAQLASLARRLSPPGGGSGGGAPAKAWPFAGKAAVAVLAVGAAFGVVSLRGAPPHGSLVSTPSSTPPAAAPPTVEAAPSSAPSESPPFAATAAPSSEMRSSATTHAPRTVAPPEDDAAEVALLERAQDALPTDPSRALALADEDARRFPNGLLRQEGEVIAVDALVRLHRKSDAESRAKRFFAAYPRSTHTTRIETILHLAP